MKLSEKVALAAESKIGIREKGGPNRGANLAEFFAADSYKPSPDFGYAWCASFVCRCVQIATKGMALTFKRPTTPGAWALIDWSMAQDDSTQTKLGPGYDIQRGDIIVFKKSHCGIAVSAVDDQGRFYTVEGNTNSAGSREGDGVYKKTRNVSEIRARIRFTK